MTSIRLTLTEREACALLHAAGLFREMLDQAQVPVGGGALDSAYVKLIAACEPLDAACGRDR